MSALDPVGGGPNAGLHLGTHPSGQRSALHQLGEVIRIGKGHQSRRIVPVAQHAWHASEKDQLLRVKRGGNRLGHSVGVDVEDAAFVVAGEARHHRHEAAL